MRRVLAAVSAAALALAVAGTTACGGDGSGSPGPGDLDVDIVVGARVRVGGGGIEPDVVTVRAGEAVSFRNVGQDRHRLVAEGALFDTGDMLPGEMFLFLFDEPGRVEYRDRHGGDGATAAVIVQPADAAGRGR